MIDWGSPQVLKGKRALIIGGAGLGVGRAIGDAFLAAGASVALVDISADGVADAVSRLTGGAGRAIGIVADVLNAGDVIRLVREAQAGLGGIDILVTVVGGQTSFGVAPAPIHEWTDEQLQRILGVNLVYVMRVLREAIPIMLAQGTGGTIVSIGSISGGPTGTPHRAAYGAGKAALSNLAKSVAAEYGYAGIRMNVVAPGAVETPRTPRDPGTTDEIADRIPLGRLARPSDVADAVIFFASDLSRYITGQTVAVDGGITASLFPPPQPAGHSSAT